MSILQTLKQSSLFKQRQNEPQPAVHAAPMPQPHHQPLEGFIDGTAGGAITGWAVDRAAPHQPVNVEIYVDKAMWALLVANEPRPDLASVFGTSGRHGFQWELPLHLADGAPHTVSLRHSPFGAEIPGSPLTVDTSHIRSSPLRVSSVPAQRVRASAVPYAGAPPRALRTGTLAPAEAYEFAATIFETAGDAVAQRPLPLKWTEPDAASL